MMKIIRLPLKLSYAYLVRDTGAVLVDTGMPGDAPRLRELLAKEGLAPEDLSLILHTHAHWDHCGSTRRLKEWTDAPIAVHRADAAMMCGGHNGELKPMGWAGRFLKPFLDRAYPGVQADILLEDECDLSPFGIPARILATPGHTAGSISLLTAEGDAIVGDLIMGGYWGGTLLSSRPTYHYFAEDAALLRASIAQLLEHAPVRILPGHGGPLDPDKVAQRFGITRLRDREIGSGNIEHSNPASLGQAGFDELRKRRRGPVSGTRCSANRFAIGADEPDRRQRLHLESGRADPGRIGERTQPWRRPADNLLGLPGVGGVRADVECRERSIHHADFDFPDARHLLQAMRAVDSPEVDHDGSALQVGQFHFVAVGVNDRQGRRGQAAQVGKTGVPEQPLYLRQLAYGERVRAGGGPKLADRPAGADRDGNSCRAQGQETPSAAGP